MHHRGKELLIIVGCELFQVKYSCLTGVFSFLRIARWRVLLLFSVLTWSPTDKGGVIHRLLPNVNSEAAKYTLPSKLGFCVLGTLLIDIGLTTPGALGSPVLLSLASLASENLTTKCSSCSFNSSQPKTKFKSNSSQAWSSGLELGLRWTWVRVCEVYLPYLLDLISSFLSYFLFKQKR